MTKPFDTRDVKLLVPTGGKADRFGAQVTEYIEETVAGVLPQPGGTSDLGAERPNGRKVDMTFHWPRGTPAPWRAASLSSTAGGTGS